jgi:serine/threonine protein kinase
MLASLFSSKPPTPPMSPMVTRSSTRSSSSGWSTATQEGTLDYKYGVIPGAQGCAIIPSLIVQGISKQRDKRYVTKIFVDEASYKEEKRNNAFVKQIDRTNQFTNVSFNEDPIDLSLLTKEDIKNCGQIIGTRADLALKKYINYEYLGKSLHTIMSHSIVLTNGDADDIIFGLTKLITKVYLMNKGELSGGKVIFHNDAHRGNIMYNPRNHNVYLIDFGLASIGSARKGDTLVDMAKLTETTGFMVTYILTTVKDLSERKKQALSKYLAFVSANYLGKVSSPRGFVPTYTAETILKASQDLTNEFQEGGSRRKTRRSGGNKTLRRSRHKVNRNMH